MDSSRRRSEAAELILSWLNGVQVPGSPGKRHNEGQGDHTLNCAPAHHQDLHRGGSFCGFVFRGPGGPAETSSKLFRGQGSP